MKPRTTRCRALIWGFGFVSSLLCDAHTHMHAHTHTHSFTHSLTHTHTHSLSLSLSLSLSPSPPGRMRLFHEVCTAPKTPRRSLPGCKPWLMRRVTEWHLQQRQQPLPVMTQTAPRQRRNSLTGALQQRVDERHQRAVVGRRVTVTAALKWRRRCAHVFRRAQRLAPSRSNSSPTSSVLLRWCAVPVCLCLCLCLCLGLGLVLCVYCWQLSFFSHHDSPTQPRTQTHSEPKRPSLGRRMWGFHSAVHSTLLSPFSRCDPGVPFSLSLSNSPQWLFSALLHTQNTHTKHTHKTHTQNTHTKHTHKTHKTHTHTQNTHMP